jgi:hypothetical protein
VLSGRPTLPREPPRPDTPKSPCHTVCATLRVVTGEWQGNSSEEGFADLEFDEDLEEKWLEEWDQVDRDAVDLVRRALRDRRGAPMPAALGEAASTVRDGLAKGDHPFAWIGQAAGLNREPTPDDDAELLIRCAAGTISPQEETGLDIEEEALLLSLEHADWLGAIVSAVRAGPGADASPNSLVDGIRNCPEVELDLDDESHLETAFWIVSLPWHVLGLTDPDQRLTPLGAWLLPRALARAWGGDFDQELDEGRH